MPLKASSEQKEQYRRQGVSVVALIAAVTMVVGCVLPWQRAEGLFSDPGIASLDGSIVLLLALFGGGVALYNYRAKRVVLRSLLSLLGIAGLGVAIMNLRLVSVWAEVLGIGTSSLVGLGLYAVMVGGALMAIAGFAGYPKSYSTLAQGDKRPSLVRKAGTAEIERSSPIGKESVSVVKSRRAAGRNSIRHGVRSAPKLSQSFKKHWYIYICGAATLGIVIEVLIWAFRYFSW